MNLTIVMLLCGTFGGLTVYLSRFCMKDRKQDKKIFSIELFKEISYGIIAAFIVPLFLNTINSDLVNKVWVEDKNIFIFSGFCLLFSLNAKLFIEKMTNKAFGELEKKIEIIDQKSDEVNKKSDALIEQNTDVPDTEDETLKKSISNNSDWISDVENIILFELGKSKLFKRIDIILNEVNKKNLYTSQSIQSIMNKMEARGLITGFVKFTTRAGETETIYALTIEGKIKFKTLVNAITWEVISTKKFISIGNSGEVYEIEVMSNEYVHKLQVKSGADSKIELKKGDKIKVKTSDGNNVLEESIEILK